MGWRFRERGKPVSPLLGAEKFTSAEPQVREKYNGLPKSFTYFIEIRRAGNTLLLFPIKFFLCFRKMGFKEE